MIIKCSSNLIIANFDQLLLHFLKTHHADFEFNLVLRWNVALDTISYSGTIDLECKFPVIWKDLHVD